MSETIHHLDFIFKCLPGMTCLQCEVKIKSLKLTSLHTIYCVVNLKARQPADLNVPNDFAERAVEKAISPTIAPNGSVVNAAESHSNERALGLGTASHSLLYHLTSRNIRGPRSTGQESYMHYWEQGYCCCGCPSLSGMLDIRRGLSRGKRMFHYRQYVPSSSKAVPEVEYIAAPFT